MNADSNARTWRKVITPPDRELRFNFKEVHEFRYLMYVLVSRDFVAGYKQTILGPLWSLINPICTTIVFTIIFGKLAALTTLDAEAVPGIVIPGFLFYMLGNICWSYFSGVTKKVAGTFINNGRIMGKVYFPRIVMPVAGTCSMLINFAIQFALFLVTYAVCLITGLAKAKLTLFLLLFPVSMVQLILLSCGMGMLISATTTKYRDLMQALDFILHLWQYFSPIAYGLALITGKWRVIYLLNPMSSIITMFRLELFGTGYFSLPVYFYSWAATIAVFLLGTVCFNKAERLFADTI